MGTIQWLFVLSKGHKLLYEFNPSSLLYFSSLLQDFINSLAYLFSKPQILLVGLSIRE
jgi:hypothetical protein